MRKWTVELDKAIFAHLMLIGIPTIVFYVLRALGLGLTGLHVAIATFYIVSSLMLIAEATVASFRRYATNAHPPAQGKLDRLYQRAKIWLGLAGHRYPVSETPIPRCTFLIAAYLPNEQDIILETLETILLKVKRPEGGLEVILAYNTPIDLPVEEELQYLASLYPELQLLRVEGSRSKAENLNAAVKYATGEIIGILDADHHPNPDCFIRAWHWIERGYDVVQGRSIIRNHAQNFLTRNIAIEFETMYGITHAARSFITDSSIFGGSNGYWRADVLREIRFNPAMLTEDIDASMRTLLGGYRILHDRSIVSTELAPVDFKSFWFQRKRWAQGWLEVSLKYQQRMWRSRKLSLWQKIFWTYLLYYCEFYSLIALQIIPLAISLSLFHQTLPLWVSDYLWLSTLLTIFTCIHQTVLTAKIASVRYPLLYFLQSMLLLFPFITLKNVIAIVGLYDHVNGKNDWLVTPRGRQPKRSSARQENPLSARTPI